jgi:exopolysaccharide production protein ExoQ
MESLKFWLGLLGIGVLLYLNRDKTVRTSKALWLPVIWVWIIGSRPPSSWFGMSMQQVAAGELPSGSPLDQLVILMLLLGGVVVMAARYRSAGKILRACWPITIYFAFCLYSLMWSEFPAWGFKRWLRASGDLIMVMIVVTDAQPVAALKRLFSRVGFLLVPTSFLVIMYYPGIGRAWDRYGYGSNVGVTDNKNLLGAVCLVVTLGTLWQVMGLFTDKKQPHRGRRLAAQCTLLLFCFYLLFAAHSATSLACAGLGMIMLLMTSMPVFRRSPGAVNALVLAIMVAGILSFAFGTWTEAVKTLGRNPDLTGRTDIWKFLAEMPSNPMLGAGFETFWTGERLVAVHRAFRGINEAHNGFLEVYLNLGWIGVGLMLVVLGQSYRRAVEAFRTDRVLGRLFLAYVVIALTYNITEAGFRMSGPAWWFFLLSAAGCTVARRRSESGSSFAGTAVIESWYSADSFPSTSRPAPIGESVSISGR